MQRTPTPDILSDLLGGAAPKPAATVKLSKLRIDGGTQMRAALDDNTVFDYVQAMIAYGGWGTFPPIVVFHDGKEYWLGDGFHRAAAFRESFPDEIAIPADIRPGTRRDAILYAAQANASHGLRRSQADKRRSVETLLRDEEWRQWSDREIARRCNVSADLVGAVRRELTPPVTVVSDSEPAPATRTFVTKHGGTAIMNTAAIGKTQPSYAAVWAIEDAVKRICEQAKPYMRELSPEHAEELRQAARTPNHSLKHAIEAALVEKGIEFRRSDLVQAMHNVASQIEQECRRKATPTVAIPIKPATSIVPSTDPVSWRDGYDGDEWYTPAEYVEAARRTFDGIIELDPASCELAQTVVQAVSYYTRFENGLDDDSNWFGTVWLNPPYSDPAPWINKAVAAHQSGDIDAAVILVNNATETGWFQKLIEHSAAFCILSRRVAFWRHDHQNVGARQGQVVFYLGPDLDAFVQHWQPFGPICRKVER